MSYDDYRKRLQASLSDAQSEKISVFAMAVYMADKAGFDMDDLENQDQPLWRVLTDMAFSFSGIPVDARFEDPEEHIGHWWDVADSTHARLTPPKL